MRSCPGRIVNRLGRRKKSYTSNPSSEVAQSPDVDEIMAYSSLPDVEVLVEDLVDSQSN
jgi:hypothetical protein